MAQLESQVIQLPPDLYCPAGHAHSAEAGRVIEALAQRELDPAVAVLMNWRVRFLIPREAVAES